MISEKILMGSQYQYNHIDVEVIKKGVEGSVLAFVATIVHASPNDSLSDGIIEINKTLWNQDSEKRPPGFLLLDTFKRTNGKTYTIMVSKDWYMNMLSKEIREKYRRQWFRYYTTC